MRGGIHTARKIKTRSKGAHYRGGAIFRVGADQSMGTAVGVGTDGIVQWIG